MIAEISKELAKTITTIAPKYGDDLHYRCEGERLKLGMFNLAGTAGFEIILAANKGIEDQGFIPLKQFCAAIKNGGTVQFFKDKVTVNSGRVSASFGIKDSYGAQKNIPPLDPDFVEVSVKELNEALKTMVAFVGDQASVDFLYEGGLLLTTRDVTNELSLDIPVTNHLGQYVAYLDAKILQDALPPCDVVKLHGSKNRPTWVLAEFADAKFTSVVAPRVRN